MFTCAIPERRSDEQLVVKHYTNEAFLYFTCTSLHVKRFATCDGSVDGHCCLFHCRTKHAYIVFPSNEIAAAVVDHFLVNPVELDGHQLLVRHYTEPPHHVPKGVMSFYFYIYISIN